MQALCPACNTKKGKKMRIDLEKMRSGQRRAVLAITRRVTDGETHTSIVLPTRYGKSDVIRIAALQLYADEIISGAIVLSPGGDLRNQIVRQSKVKEMCERYSIPVAIGKKVHEWRHAENDPFANDRYLISTTIQYANRNTDDIANLINSRFYMTGLPTLVFVDETHMVSSKNKWGKSISRFITDDNGNDNGGRVVLLTATADRADGVSIPGFRYTVIDTEATYKSVRTPVGNMVKVDFYEGKKDLVKINADCEVTFKEAWDEKPSPLCTLSRDCIDVSVRQVIEGVHAEDDEKLSELSPSQAKMIIGKAVRDENVMRKGVTMFVSELQRARDQFPDLAGIVFTGADEDSDSVANEHAGKVRELIESMSDLECVIATSKSEDDTVSNHLSKFERGSGDVLIVKNAGGAGFDCSRLKVLLDLSSVRTFSSTVQRVMRVATPHGKVNNAVVITLADAIMSAIWERVVTDSGGEWVEGEMDLCKSIIVPVTEEPPSRARTWAIEGGLLSSYDDTQGNLGDMNFRDEVEEILDAFPILITTYTKPMIAERLGKRKNSKVEVFPDDEIKDYQDAINSCAKRIVRHRESGLVYDADRYRKTSKEVYKEIFQIAKCEICKIDYVSDIEQLKKIKAAAHQVADDSGVLWH
jgi:superfamily II DNA or RNA helicase